MTDRRQLTSLGAILDRTRWDYAPRDRARADLLSPAGSLFSAVPWDQADAFDHPTAESDRPAGDRDQDVVTTLR